MRSFENEVEVQHAQIDALSKSLDRRRQQKSPEGNELDHNATIQSLEKELKSAQSKLDAAVIEKSKLTAELEETREALLASRVEFAKAEERLALACSQQKLTESNEETARMLKQLQDVWADVGVSLEHRDAVRLRLLHCVEDACSNMLDEATKLRDDKNQEVSDLTRHLNEMYSALGLKETVSITHDINTSPRTISNQCEILNLQRRHVQPKYDSAIVRCTQLIDEVETLAAELHPITNDLSQNLKSLMHNKRLGTKRKRDQFAQHRTSMEVSREARAKVSRHVETLMNEMQPSGESSQVNDSTSRHNANLSAKPQHHTESASMAPGSLSALFLDECEKDIKRLRLFKSDKMLSNVDTCEKVRSAAKEMHASMSEMSTMVIYSLKRRSAGIPGWWNDSIADQVYGALFKQGSVLVNGSFTSHLELVLEIVQVVAHGRRLLSDELRKVIEESHAALLATAEGCEVDVSDLYQSLHDALFHLPPLSKEHVQACIDEMQVLVTASESVSQSEIETLTVLWEGLNLTSSERGLFWSELEESASKLQMTTTSPFDRVLDDCTTGVEEWVFKSSKDATKVQRVLRVRVFKLKKIHEEVIRLKRKQEVKNRIMSLDSELKILDSQLTEFEANSKRRLAAKKTKSSTLLEEERFRKQMKGMFASKADALGKMLSDWESTEGPINDTDMLSDVVKDMLENSDRIDEWMKEKTRFMHLRTTHTKVKTSSSLRPSSGSDRARKSQHPTAPYSSSSSRTAKVANARAISAVSNLPTRRGVPSSRSTVVSSHQSGTSKSSSPNHSSEASSGRQARKAPLSSSTHNSKGEPEKAARKNPPPLQVGGNTSPEVLLPFGNLLVDTPVAKENKSQF